MADNKLLGTGGLYYGSNEISKAYMGNNLVWEKAGEAGPDYSKEYFCIEAVEYCSITFAPQAPTENGHMFWYIKYEHAAYDRPPMDYVYAMFYNADCDVFDPYSDHELHISLDIGDIVYIIGNMDKGVSKYSTSLSNTFTFTGQVNLSGNIMSLTHGVHRNTLEITWPEDLPEKNYTQYTNTNIGELARLFKNQPVVDAGNLVLSSSVLNNYTYWEMFSGCEYLTTAPKELPALTVYGYTYALMFQGCTSLTTAPKLSATTLGRYCYRTMFQFCTSLTTAPELPATTLVPSCYVGMFQGCTSLTTAPVLPATTLVSSCYQRMFMDCTKLNYIKAMFTTTPGSYTTNWVSNVAATGTFVKNSAATWNVSGNSGIPSGWTVQTASS